MKDAYDIKSQIYDEHEVLCEASMIVHQAKMQSAGESAVFMRLNDVETALLNRYITETLRIVKEACR